jgi:hypothetical protein
MSLFLALTCCTAGAVIGAVVVTILAGRPTDSLR